MAKLDIDEDAIRKLAALLDETGLSEIEVQEGETSLKVSRAATAVSGALALPPALASQPLANATATEDQAAPEHVVQSPMVGTAYLQPEPGAAPFVSVGQTIKPGDTIMIIEAMKVMNPIRSEQAGTISAILVEDGQPVEFGEALVALA